MDEPQLHNFARHYQLLELENCADWDMARANYRRLVHLWHPDKFAHKPKERAHAQHQFIDLAKAYNELRNFYRNNDRLPYQSNQPSSRQKRINQENASGDVHDDDLDSDTENSDTNFLRRSPTKRSKFTSKGKINKSVWVFAGCTIMLGTVMLFLVLDRRANRAVEQQGREIVKDAAPSEFLPTASQIRRFNSRGAFVKPTQ